jgi:hypothetical protein
MRATIFQFHSLSAEDRMGYRARALSLCSYVKTKLFSPAVDTVLRRRIVKRGSMPGVSVLALGGLLLSNCQQQWVSPYSADLQKRASEMLYDVTLWEGQMGDAAGTAAADPRHPDVKAKLQQWNSDIEVMATIQLSIDPQSTTCDKFLQAISGSVPEELQKASTTIAAAGRSSTSTPLGNYCESLPDTFDRMKIQVSERFPRVLDQQCKLPWLSDIYFRKLAEARATAGALTAPRPQTLQSVAVASPPPDQEVLAKSRCGALFELSTSPGIRTVHGNLVEPLVVELDAIIYREGRQAPPSGK